MIAFLVLVSSTLALPDLTITEEYYYSPGVLAPDVNDSVGYSIVVTNVGDSVFEGSFTVASFLDNAFLRSETFSETTILAPGDSLVDRQYAYTNFEELGQHEINIVVDYYNDVEEFNEDNNDISIFVNVIEESTLIGDSFICLDESGDEFVNGFVRLENNNVPFRIDNDRCLNNNMILEFFCASNGSSSPNSNVILCENGCSDGVCVILTNEAPVLSFEDVIIDESDNSLIIINLEDYINDSNTNFDDLNISVDWLFNELNVPTEYNQENQELIINMYPEFSLDYHTPHLVIFNVEVSDNVNSVVQEVNISYETNYKALRGNMINLYSEEIVSDNNFMGEYNNVGEILVNEVLSSFIGFYPVDENPIIQIENPDYYTSRRNLYQALGEDDVVLDLTFVPNQTGGNEDVIEQGFTTSFGFVRFRWVDVPNLVICPFDSSNYQQVTPGAVQNAQTIMNDYLFDSTNGLMDPEDNLIIAETWGECLSYAVEGTLMVGWNHQVPGSGNNGYQAGADGIIYYSGATMRSSSAHPVVYAQEILQSIGPAQDLDEFGLPSVFNDPGATYPTDMDIQWMQRLYSRMPLNGVNDLDPIDIVRARVDSFFRIGDFVETRSFMDYTTLAGDKLIISKHLGFKPRGASSGVVNKAPKNARVEYFDLSSDIVDLDNAKSYRGILSSKDLKVIEDRFNVFNKKESKPQVSTKNLKTDKLDSESKKKDSLKK